MNPLAVIPYLGLILSLQSVFLFFYFIFYFKLLSPCHHVLRGSSLRGCACPCSSKIDDPRPDPLRLLLLPRPPLARGSTFLLPSPPPPRRLEISAAGRRPELLLEKDPAVGDDGPEVPSSVSFNIQLYCEWANEDRGDLTLDMELLAAILPPLGVVVDENDDEEEEEGKEDTSARGSLIRSSNENGLGGGGGVGGTIGDDKRISGSGAGGNCFDRASTGMTYVVVEVDSAEY